MKHYKLTALIGLILMISVACNSSSHSNQLIGTWKCYELSNSVMTISYDSNLCSNYDQLHSDPLQYRFMSNNTVAYKNLGGACLSESICNYSVDRSSLTIGNTTYTLELLTDSELHFKGDAMTLFTLHKYIRTQ